MLLCLHLEQPVSGSEEGGSQLMLCTENFVLCFVCSQLGAGQGNTSPCLGLNVMSPWGIQCCTKVSFKNELTFPRFYIFLNFTFIINDPFRKLTLRLLMSYIYMEHLFLMFLDHTQRRSTVGRTPLDE